MLISLYPGDIFIRDVYYRNYLSFPQFWPRKISDPDLYISLLFSYLSWPDTYLGQINGLFLGKKISGPDKQTWTTLGLPWMGRQNNISEHPVDYGGGGGDPATNVKDAEGFVKSAFYFGYIVTQGYIGCSKFITYYLYIVQII